jgi:hypothetical protein
MDLHAQTKQLWDSKASDYADQLARRIRAAEPDVEKAARQFREWKPLRFYISVSGASGVPSFSIRFRGQEVARLKVAPIPTIHVDSKHERATGKYFGLNTPVWKDGRDWSSPDATKFRASFRQIAARTASGHVEEHAFESRMIEEMEKGDSKTKFAGSFAGVRPVLLAGFPFQCVLPISASKGIPVATNGHIDILTRRRGSDGRVRIGIWELKRPGELAHALEQAYIYTTTLALMLRSKSGTDWYRIFGFTRPLPSKLELESVVAVSQSARPAVDRAARKFLEENPFVLDGNVHIKPFAAYYDPETLKIDFQPLART